MSQQRMVRIGGGSAGLGDGIVGIPQLLRGGELDYLMLDYLSEYFMPHAGRNRQRDPRAGYVPGFPDEIVALAGHDLAGSRVEIIGDEESWGANARTQGSREIFCRISIEAGDDKT